MTKAIIFITLLLAAILIHDAVNGIIGSEGGKRDMSEQMTKRSTFSKRDTIPFRQQRDFLVKMREAMVSSLTHPFESKVTN